MNQYVNTLQKIKALLKEDDKLTTAQCECYQWQILVKVPGHDATFVVGKGGVNTIFYSASSTDRKVCYPEDILELLEKLSKSKVFVYLALDKKKNEIGYSVSLKRARKMEGARYIKALYLNGKQSLIQKKAPDLFGKAQWEEIA